MICWSKHSKKFTCIFYHYPLAPTILSRTFLTDHKKITNAMGNYSLSSLIWTTLRCKQLKSDCLHAFPSWKQCECSITSVHCRSWSCYNYCLFCHGIIFDLILLRLCSQCCFQMHHDKSFRWTNFNSLHEAYIMHRW